MIDSFSQAQLDRIIQKVSALKTDTEWLIKNTYTGNAHGFLPNPVLSSQEVEAFEIAHQVKLPAGYREFLLQVGNGGLGPGHGLLSLHGWNRAILMEEDVPADFIARPCPILPEMNLENKVWYKSLQIKQEEAYQGTLSLVDAGCAMFWVLIVTGSARGRVMYIDWDGYKPYFPSEPDFLTWYEKWLDETIVYRQIGQALSNFATLHQVGRVTARTRLCRIFNRNYGVDIAYFSQQKQVHIPIKGQIPLPPDVMVKIISSEGLQNTLTQVADFLAAGTTIWLIYPTQRNIAVCVPGKPVQMIAYDGVLDGGDVLPSFQLTLTQIFPKAGN